MLHKDSGYMMCISHDLIGQNFQLSDRVLATTYDEMDTGKPTRHIVTLLGPWFMPFFSGCEASSFAFFSAS